MNIGLIGCGRVAMGHLRVYQRIQDARVVAVSDVEPEKARAFAEKYGISKYFSDYAKLLENKDIDFVDICTPTSTHSVIACDAAKSGHNILLEKPMARSSAQCDEMILESKRHGVKLCICHNQIFYSSIRQAKALVDSGQYHPVSFRTCVKESPELFGAPGWNMTKEENGILWEAGCHPAYLQLHFLKNITEVYATGNKTKYPVYDNFSVLLRTSNHSYGTIEVSWLSKTSEIIYEIDSSDGKRAIINRHSDSLTERSEGSNVGISYQIRWVIGHYLPSHKTLKNEFGYWIGHYYLIDEYMKSLKNGTDPPVLPEEGRRTIELLECIEESLDKHQPVQLKQV